MANALALSRTQIAAADRTKRAARAERSRRTAGQASGLVALNVAVIAAVVAIGFAYLLQVNSLATKGFVISELEQRVGELERAGQQLELQAIQLQSLENVRQKVDGLSMVPATDARYVKVQPTAVAFR